MGTCLQPRGAGDGAPAGLAAAGLHIYCERQLVGDLQENSGNQSLPLRRPLPDEQECKPSNESGGDPLRLQCWANSTHLGSGSLRQRLARSALAISTGTRLRLSCRQEPRRGPLCTK